MMKRILLAIALLALAQTSMACDEACKRAKAEAASGMKFGSHLSVKSCKSIATDFLIQARKSLETYRDKQLPTVHRGGARNIRSFISQRKDWLQECDKYLELTEQGRIFRDKETTDKIFGSMTELSEALHKIMMRPKNPDESKELVAAPAGLKFDELFKLMDDHYLDLQKRGML